MAGAEFPEILQEKKRAIQGPKEERPAWPPGYIAGIRAGLIRHNAASSPAGSDRFLRISCLKPESSISNSEGQESMLE